MWYCLSCDFVDDVQGMAMTDPEAGTLECPVCHSEGIFEGEDGDDDVAFTREDYDERN